MRYFRLLVLLTIAHTTLWGGWTEQTLQNMTLEQKIGQLMVVRCYSNGVDATSEKAGPQFITDIEELITKYQVGGLLLKRRWDPLSQRHLVQHYQALSTIPLLICQDCEWGVGMRVANTISFPRNMTLGAIQDRSLLYQLGREIGRECRALGIDVNLAPVVDVNSNHLNPVIHMRSFGDDPHRVAECASQVARGLSDAGVIACAKHFPGHGDTSVDSHLAIPIVGHGRKRLEEVEWVPYRRLIGEGIPMVMTAHLQVPALSAEPATLSPEILNGILRNDLGFKGVIISDALDMAGIASGRDSGELAVEALLAGNDLLVCPLDLPLVIAKVKEAMVSGRLTAQELDRKVERVLRVKESLRALPDQTGAVIVTEAALQLKRRLFQEAITLVKNEGDMVPMVAGKGSIALVQIGGGSDSMFAKLVENQYAIHRSYVSYDSSPVEQAALVKSLGESQQVVVAVFGTGSVDVTIGEVRRALPPDRYGVSESTVGLVKSLHAAGHRVFVVLFTSPYALQFFGDEAALLMAYEEDQDAQHAAAQVLVGDIEAKGVVPISLRR